jgi:hypothetical protein|nr:MAG TPA: lipoprotein [Caudoviricetes sp.]
MKKVVSFLLAGLMVVCLAGCSGNSGEDEEESNTSETSSVTPEEDMLSKFENLGFTSDEAKTMTDIFQNIGISQIGEITTALGTGIDELQAFVAPVYDSNQLQVNFTIENRDLCYVALAGVPGYKPELYISFFGKLKVREERTISMVDLFDRWVDDTDYHQPIEDSYLAKVDYENQEIIELKENAIQ